MELYAFSENEQLADELFDDLDESMQGFVQIMRFVRTVFIESDLRFENISTLGLEDIIEKKYSEALARSVGACLSDLFELDQRLRFEDIEEAEAEVLQLHLQEQFLEN